MGGPRIRFYRPAEELRPYISAYYFTDLDEGPPVHDLMHPEWGNVRATLSGYWTFESARTSANSNDMPLRLYGPTSRTTRVTGYPPTRTASAGLLPLGWAHLIALPAHKYADRIVSFSDAVADDAHVLWRELFCTKDDAALRAVFDDFFRRRLARRVEPSTQLVQAHAALLDPNIATATEFAARLGLSSRHVARLSLDMFGFPPKLLLRRQRFLRTLHMMRSRLDEPWARLLDETYCDQSHFVRDFHRFMGMAPSDYFALSRTLLDPAARLRQQAIGQTLQGLHPAMSDLSKRS